MGLGIPPTGTMPDVERLADLFKLLADPSRLQLLWWIGQRGEVSVGELSARTGLSQANVSKHLQVLRLGGLVACRKEGNNRLYFLADPRCFQMCIESLTHLSQKAQEGGASCED
ncbi:MAG: metalloregulator ArsR/SmtB family transcription factor [Gloeomargarita sp. GMQP_bins_120]